MLKKTLLAMFALAVAAQANAKVLGTEWGVTAGVRYNSESVKDAFKGSINGLSLRSNLTYNVGIHASLAFMGIAIQPELNYGYTSMNLTVPQSGAADYTTTVKAHDIEVPVLLSLRFLPVVRFNVGPVFNIMSRATYKNAAGEKEMYGQLHPSCGYAAGLSLCLVKKLLIDARFVGYFNKTYHELPDVGVDSGFKSKTYSVGLKLGYLF